MKSLRFGATTATASLAFVLACASATNAPTAPAPTAQPSVAEVGVETLAPPVPVHASSEAFVAAAHPAALQAWFGRLSKVLPTGAVSRIERTLGLTSGALATRRFFDELGIDGDGVLTVESFELDEPGRAQARRLRAVDRSATDDALADALSGEPRRAREGWFLTRVRVPTRTGSKLQRTIETAVGEARASRWQAPSPDVAVFGVSDTLWALRQNTDSLEIGIALGRRDLRGTDARSAVAALVSWAPSHPPVLDRDDIAVELQPGPVGEAGLWLDAMRVFDAVSQDGIEPDLARRLLAVGFREATQSLRISAPNGAPRYSLVRATARGQELTIRPTLAKDADPLDSTTWLTEGPTATDVVVDPSTASFSINGGLLYGWPLLPKTQGQNPYRGGAAVNAIREAGFAGAFAAIGDAPFVIGRTAMEDAEPIGQATLPFMRRFERLGLANGSGSDGTVFFGLMAPSSGDADAACALARESASCSKAERILPKGITSLKGFFVQRKLIDGRWLIAASRNKRSLETAHMSLKKGARPALRASVDLDEVFGMAHGTFGRWNAVARIGSDSRSFEVTCQPVP